MAVYSRTKAFVLKEIEREEADRAFTLFSRDFGKIEVLARGVRKINSKLKPGLSLLTLSEIEFVEGRRVKILVGTSPVNPFPEIKKNLEKLKWAYQIVFALEKLVKGQEKDEKIWQLLFRAFEALESLAPEHNKPRLFFFTFFWRLLALLGYQPGLYHCWQCKKILGSARFYLLVPEGLVCQDCLSAKRARPPEARSETVKILRRLASDNWEEFVSERMGTEQEKELQRALAPFLLHYLKNE